MNIITLNPENANYISNFVVNYIFDAMSKDKILSDLSSLPEFSQPFIKLIESFFRNESSKNNQIDLDKLIQFNQSFENLAPENPDDSELYLEGAYDQTNDIYASSFINLKTAQFQKYVVDAAKYLIPIVKKSLGPILNSLIPVFGPLLERLFYWLMDQIETLLHSIENSIIEKLDPEFWKELVLSYNAYDAINEARRSEMYSVEAYNQMLENNETRGYGGQLHSQGAYEVFGPKFKEQFSEQVVQNPELVNSRYKDDPNVGPRVKQNFQQIIATNNKRFVKVAQQEMSEASQSQLKELQSVVPTWDIRNVLEEVHTIYQSPDISQQDKQQAVDATISRYMRDIQPLYQFLKENNYPTPDTAQ